MAQLSAQQRQQQHHGRQPHVPDVVQSFGAIRIETCDDGGPTPLDRARGITARMASGNVNTSPSSWLTNPCSTAGAVGVTDPRPCSGSAVGFRSCRSRGRLAYTHRPHSEIWHQLQSITHRARTSVCILRIQSAETPMTFHPPGIGLFTFSTSFANANQWQGARARNKRSGRGHSAACHPGKQQPNSIIYRPLGWGDRCGRRLDIR